MQRGHGLTLTIWPSIVERTERTSPLPLHCGHFAGLRARLGAAARAGLAAAEGAELDLLLGAGDRLGEGQAQVVAQVRAGRRSPATAGPRGALAEEGVEEVAEALEAAERARTPSGPPPDARPTERVVGLPALRIGEDLVGLVDLLEALIGAGLRADVRMPLLGEPPEGRLMSASDAPRGTPRMS